MTRLQRVLLALAMLGIVMMLMWVPYKATYEWRGSSWTTASAGYGWIFAPPSSRVCTFAIAEHLDSRLSRFDRDECQISLDTRQLLMTLAAAAIGTAALILLLGLLRPKGPSSRKPAVARTSNELPRAAKRNDENSELVREIARLDPTLPLGSGDMSAAFPLVITAKHDYVAVEYRVIELMHNQLQGLEAELLTQGLLEQDGRHVDALTYGYRRQGSAEWERKKTYHFDITEGMNEFVRKLNKQWWEFWK